MRQSTRSAQKATFPAPLKGAQERGLPALLLHAPFMVLSLSTPATADWSTTDDHHRARTPTVHLQRHPSAHMLSPHAPVKVLRRAACCEERPCMGCSSTPRAVHWSPTLHAAQAQGHRLAHARGRRKSPTSPPTESANSYPPRDATQRKTNDKRQTAAHASTEQE